MSWPNRPTILVTPSINKPRTVELIRKAIEALGDMDGIKVTIKCHPAMPYDRVRGDRDMRPLPSNFEVAGSGSVETLAKLLAQTDIVIYNDGTSTVFDALAMGIPLVMVNPEYGLPLDSLDGFPEARVVTRHPHEIRQACQKLLS